MRKTLLICASLALSAALALAKTPADNAQFAGTWALDISQTKNVPDGLESYTMTVVQDSQQVKVDTALSGDLRPTPRTGGQNSGGYPGGGGGMGRGGMGGGMGGMGGGMGGMGRGGMGGMGRGGMGGGGMGRGGMSPQRAEFMAFKLYPTSAAYHLDGTQGSAQLGGTDATEATSKAEWESGGKELKIALDAKDNSGYKESEIKLKDEWKLDGNYLKVSRSVHTSNGSETVHLVFHKQPVEAAQAPAATPNQ